jgi:hypothetical protein
MTVNNKSWKKYSIQTPGIEFVNISSHQRQSPTVQTGLRGNMGNQPKYCFHLYFAYGGLGNVININSFFIQIWQTYWCLCLTDVWHESLQLMEGIEKPHTGKYKEITND